MKERLQFQISNFEPSIYSNVVNHYQCHHTKMLRVNNYSDANEKELKIQQNTRKSIKILILRGIPNRLYRFAVSRPQAMFSQQAS
jgi:hypothetical protein